jgi:MFS family permease
LRVYTDPVPAAEPLDSLAFILLAVLVLLVVLGLMLEAPGLGIVLAIVSTLALVRAMSTARKSEEAGMPMSGRHKIGAFFGSLGVVVLTGVGAFIAFFASFCFVAMQGISNPKWRDEKTQFISVAAGVVAGIYVLIRLLKKYWPKQGGSGKKP